jgi:starch phosphorylase
VLDGRPDLDRAARDLAERIPEPLEPFARLAYNYRWSWHPDGPALFGSIDPGRWERCLQNPVRLLEEAPMSALHRAASDGELIERAHRLEAAISEELERPWNDETEWDRPVAFFCAEYGIHVSLPVYSGGLGALAGDFVKEASDRALPFVAVGLMYRQGYFRQRIDASGWQHEYWIDTDPERLPAALVRGEDGEPITVGVAIGEREVRVQIWRVEVGRVPLFLLDTELPENEEVDRWISSRLYVGDPGTRLAQYIVLGVGGMRALGALGIRPGTLHLNEGHAALAPLELARAEVAGGTAPENALEHARAQTVFTTHTPVPAGNDSYPGDQVEAAIGTLARELGAPVAELIRLGRTHPDAEHEPFGVTQFALRMSSSAGGVSRRHGEVARAMWQELWPDSPVENVPIGHVTNGVHIPTWVGKSMRELLDRHLGEGWMERAADPGTWEAVDDIPDHELWEVRHRQRAELVDFARGRSIGDRLARDDLPEYVQAAAKTFDPGTLTIGFARRVATYKRLALLGSDPDRLLRLLSGDRPIQVLLAGKAHPRDDEAKRVLQALFGMKGAPEVGQHVIVLDDYDLATAARLVQGCDVWLNLPRPPLEASGTSGMKSVMNGGLQLSVLDGWWAEGYDGSNGWALSGEVDDDHAAQDARHAAELFRVLEEEVVPAFYDRTEDGIPGAWIQCMRASLRTLGPEFSATRMLSGYMNGAYRRHAPMPR